MSKKNMSEEQKENSIKAQKAQIDKRIAKIKKDDRRRAAIEFLESIDAPSMTLAAIAFKLNEAGHRTVRGHLFDATGVKYLLAWRQKYYAPKNKKSLIEIGIAYNQEKMQVMMAMQMNGKGLVDFVSRYPNHVAIVAFDYAIKSYPYGADTERHEEGIRQGTTVIGEDMYPLSTPSNDEYSLELSRFGGEPQQDVAWYSFLSDSDFMLIYSGKQWSIGYQEDDRWLAIEGMTKEVVDNANAMPFHNAFDYLLRMVSAIKVGAEWCDI